MGFTALSCVLLVRLGDFILCDTEAIECLQGSSTNGSRKLFCTKQRVYLYFVCIFLLYIQEFV